MKFILSTLTVAAFAAVATAQPNGATFLPNANQTNKVCICMGRGGVGGHRGSVGRYNTQEWHGRGSTGMHYTKAEEGGEGGEEHQWMPPPPVLFHLLSLSHLQERK